MSLDNDLLAWVSENCVSKRRSDLEIPDVEIMSLESVPKTTRSCFLSLTIPKNSYTSGTHYKNAITKLLLSAIAIS